MKTLKIKNADYSLADILFRCYYNQLDCPLENEYFCFEILCRDGFSSVLSGRYTCKTAHGVKEGLRQLLTELKNKNITLGISNEFTYHENASKFFGIEFNAKDWIDGAIEHLLKESAIHGAAGNSSATPAQQTLCDASLNAENGTAQS